jgi:hypothetical protein
MMGEGKQEEDGGNRKKGENDIQICGSRQKTLLRPTDIPLPLKEAMPSPYPEIRVYYLISIRLLAVATGNFYES